MYDELFYMFLFNVHHLSCHQQEDMEPYERLLSPVNKKGPRRAMIAYQLRSRSSDLSQENKPQERKLETERKEVVDKQGDKADELEASEDEEREEEEEEEEEEEGEEGESSYYNLRKRRPIVYQYQPVLQVWTRVCVW